jgi:hypothetical protein
MVLAPIHLGELRPQQDKTFLEPDGMQVVEVEVGLQLTQALLLEVKVEELLLL